MGHSKRSVGVWLALCALGCGNTSTETSTDPVTGTSDASLPEAGVDAHVAAPEHPAHPTTHPTHPVADAQVMDAQTAPSDAGTTHDSGSCHPACTGKECGADGCGGSCGTCPDDQVCAQNGTCNCQPSCTGKMCGDDGCGGSCGTCPDGRTCSASGDACNCVPDCNGRACGDDGCGGSCGDCGAMVCNTRDGVCVASCTPNCSGRSCGDDGCGGSCGDCGNNQTCTQAGQCVCAPQCVARACGDDACGGSCGNCNDNQSCNGAGQCACKPNCTGRVCGDDGCGGSCGPCGSNQACNASGQCACVPNCNGHACGDNGCGGSCGMCSNGSQCNAGGQCVPQTGGPTFADVYGLFTNTCAMHCHRGSFPAGSLNLSSQSTAYSNLYNMPSTQCADRRRVNPGSPSTSYLVDKLANTNLCAGVRMPKGGPYLTNAQIDTVRAWITAGAPP